MFSSKTTLNDMKVVRNALLDRITNPEKLPFSYKLDDVAYAGIPAEFSPKSTRKVIDANIIERDYVAEVSKGLELRVETYEYKDFAVFEWTAFFTNTGKKRSPVISDFTGIDMFLPKKSGVTLFHNNGDFCGREGLETVEQNLKVGEFIEPEAANGRSCDRAWPYYRILTGDIGYNVAIGWPGTWHGHIENTKKGVYFMAKQKNTHFYLRPGETVRGPRMCVMGFEGDSDKGINAWRRFFFAHYLPRTEGNMLKPKMCFSFGGGGEEFTLATEENQINAINTFVKRGVKPDIWWIDAGWYPCKDEEGVKRWVRTGKWYPDPEKFPNGLGPVGAECAKHGIQFLLWFEPERVTLKYWPEEYPNEYVLHLKKPKNSAFYDGMGLLDLGNPDCRVWLTDLVKKTLADGGVKIYRQDFNGGQFPVSWWEENDENKNRKGITENKHIQGYLRFWDDLLVDIPDLWIDSCASGGRRNDIEAMRRAVALHPTDFGYGEHPVKQAFQKTWFEWTPYFRSIASSWDDAEGNYPSDKTLRCHGYDSYAGHCAFAPATTFGAGITSDDVSFNNAKKFKSLWEKAAPYTLNSDFFCLTPVRKSNEDYFAIQFSREDTKDGILQVIRNTRCDVESITLKPKAINETATYEFFAPETNERFEITGAKLIKEGYTFSIPKRSGILYFYKEI